MPKICSGPSSGQGRRLDDEISVPTPRGYVRGYDGTSMSEQKLEEVAACFSVGPQSECLSLRRLH